MIFEYSLFFSTIFSILIAGTTLGIYFRLKKLTSPHFSKHINLTAEKVNRVNLYIKITYIFLSFVILCRVIYLISFPLELYYSTYTDRLFSLRFVFLVQNSFFTMLFVSAFFLILIGYSLKLEYRLIYLKYLFLSLSLTITLDMLASAFIFITITLQMMFPAWNTPVLDLESNYSVQPIFVGSALLFLAIVTVLYFMTRKRENRFVAISYNILFLINILFLLTGIWYRLSYFFNEESLLYSSMSLFNYNQWFIGWLLMIIVMSALSAYIISMVMMVLRNKFLHFNFGLHYILEFNRIGLLCMYGLAVICFLPDILLYWYQ